MSDTIFHKIMRKEVPAEIVHEDEQCIAFRDVNPVSPTHVLVVPKEKIPTLNDALPEHAPILGHLMYVAAEVARKEGLNANGYRVVINCGADGAQTVFQLHLHIVGGRKFGWPPG